MSNAVIFAASPYCCAILAVGNPRSLIVLPEYRFGLVVCDLTPCWMYVAASMVLRSRTAGVCLGGYCTLN